MFGSELTRSPSPSLRHCTALGRGRGPEHVGGYSRGAGFAPYIRCVLLFAAAYVHRCRPLASYEPAHADLPSAPTLTMQLVCQAVHLLPKNGAQLFAPGGALAQQTVGVLVSRILSSPARQMARQDIVLDNSSLPRVLILSLSPAPHLNTTAIAARGVFELQYPVPRRGIVPWGSQAGRDSQTGMSVRPSRHSECPLFADLD